MSPERLIEIIAYNNYRNTLVGSPAPRVKEQFERMTHPQVGDLVVEVTTIHDEKRNGTRLGKLTRIALEPMYTPDEWNEAEEGRPIPKERVWYIELPDGTEYRWNNADFIAIQTNLQYYGGAFESDGDAWPLTPETPSVSGAVTTTTDTDG